MLSVNISANMDMVSEAYLCNEIRLISDLLNPHEEGVVWKIDPRWVQQSAKTAFNAKALRQFRKHPFTANVLVTWFKIKQYELDCIRTAAEGLRLNVAQDKIQEFAGLSSV